LKLVRLLELFTELRPEQANTSAQPTGSIPNRPKLDTVPALELTPDIPPVPDVTPATENRSVRLGMVFAPPEF
jgi:hypothetical protein